MTAPSPVSGQRDFLRRLLPPVTLIGGYHPAENPLDRRRLVVVSRIWRLGTSSVTVRGFVHAEGFAERAPMDGRVIFGAGGQVSYRFDFVSDEREQCRVTLSQRLLPPTLRSFTELTGALELTDGAIAVGPATLRFDWRKLTLEIA